MTDANTPTIEERYTSATGTSNLKVQLDRANVADILIAAGWSRNRFGTALMRLQSEWDGTPRPRPLTPAALRVLAGVLMKHPPMVLSQRGVQEWPMWRAKLQAHEWHMQELGLQYQRLKTLPEAREALAKFGWLSKIEQSETKAAAVLSWWLHPICPTCGGGGYELIAGTNRQSTRACAHCKGSGETKRPHGHDGWLMYAEIARSLDSAHDSIGENRRTVRDRKAWCHVQATNRAARG
jgi:hypothetical protein